MLFKLMTLVHLCAAFPLKCPEAAQWRLRANSHCADSSKYSCLWDDNIKEYSENCTRFDFQNAGRKSVLRGGIDANECSKERYQPSGYTLYTNASTNCILLKSFCNEEGQVVYDHGNRTTDATCICNYRRGFAFLIKPNNPCYCKPSQEDCSCFLKICSNSSHILSPDYKCTIDSDLPPVSNGRAITDENDNNGRRPNITETFPRDDNYVTVPGRNHSAIVVLSIFGGAIFVVLLVIFVQRLWRYYFRDLRKKGPEPELRLIEGDPLILQYMLPIKRQRLRLFKDDKYIAEKVNLKKNVFTIENVTQVDEGNYFAQVFYTRSRITKVTVQSMFTSKFNPISCVEGDELQLKCSVYAEDILVEWIKNNMNIEQNENTSIKRAGKYHCLTFQQAKLSDAGKYSMVARNVSKQQTVTIKAMFTSEFNTLYCIEGEKLQLTCSVYSEAIDVEWRFQDNTKIENNETTSIGSDGKNHFMTIQCAKSSDSGQYIIVAGNVRKRLTVTVSKDKRESKNLYMRRNLTEARGKCYSAQRKGIFNWKLLKKSLKPIDIIDCFITSGFVNRDLWDFIIKDSMRSQMDSILSYALKNIQTSDDYDKFEKLVVKCNRNVLLKTPNDEHDESIQVHGMAEHRFRENRELIEKELYPKDYIDSFLVQFIISLVDHEELRNKENIREQMASSFLEIIQQQAYIAKGSMKCLIYSFKEIDSKVLKCLAKLMDSDLLNGNSKFTADEELQKIIVDRNDCRISIVCKWTYLKDNFDPKDMIDKLYIAGLVDEDRKDIIRDKPRREKVYSTLRNIIRRIDGKSMFLKLKSILEEENPFIYKELNVKAAKRELPCRQDYEIKQLQLNLQKLEKDIQAEFDKNYIDHFVECNVFDMDDHEIILEATHSENGRAKCFFEKISSIQYIEKGSVDCLAECLLGSKNRKNTRKPLAKLLFAEKMPEQEINRTHININPEEETLFTNKTDKLTKATSRLAFGDTDIKDAVENATFDVVTTSSFEFEGLQSKPEDTKRSSVVIYLQSDGENVKFVVEKSIVNGDFTTFIMNLLDDEQIKMHMSSEKKYKLSVTIHSKEQQTESNLVEHDNPKMRIIKANRKLLEEECDPMPLLKAVFVGNLEKYKSIENLSPENVADFKQQFSEINEIPERRKRVKQFLNIAEDLIVADKLWELIADIANTFSMKKMRDDLNSEQNYNSSSDEGLIFEGKYEVWKTEEDIQSPLQSFILQEIKKRGHQEDRMSYKDLKSPEDIFLPGMKNAETEVVKGNGDGFVSEQLDEEIKTGLNNLQLESETEESNCGTVNKTPVTVQKPGFSVKQIQQTVHKSELAVNKTQEYTNKPEELEQSVNTQQDKFYEERYQSQVAMEPQTSQAEENYMRMSLLLSKIAPRAVRVLFDSEFHPACLNAAIMSEINKFHHLLKTRIINRSHWALLFPRKGCPDSKTFDVTLMSTLLTHIAMLNRMDRLPNEFDTSPSADLARIKYYRNYVTNNKDGRIDNTLFSIAWEDIIRAVGRLGGHDMLDECNKLRAPTFRQSTVPWNIRVQINQILENWKMHDSHFVETRAAKHVLKCIQENSCVTITASFGVGKTATLRHVALKMADEGYDVLLVTNSHDIIQFYDPNKKTLFVMDDFCGIYSINQSDLNSLESVMQRLKLMIQNKKTKILVACRLQVFHDYKFQSLSIFRTGVCNLQLEDLCLSQMEKQSVSELYLGKKALEVYQYCDLYKCFPLLCKLYADNPELNIAEFFKNPFSVYETELEKLYQKGYNVKYSALALCVMFNNRLEEKMLTDEIDTGKRIIIENTNKECRLDRGTSTLLLLDELKSLEHSFIKKTLNVYSSINNNIFNFLAYHFGHTMIKCLINNADSELIMRRFVLERKDDMDPFITIVPPKYHHMYMQRLIEDWFKGILHCVFNNINMKIPVFRQRFLCFLNTLDISNQKKLAHTCDVNNKDNVLLQCCQYDDIPFIQWCIYLGIDVNQCNYKGMSPLYISAQEGLTEVVMLLLKNKADINKCTDDGASPLYVACQKNHIEIVKLLLDKKAVIDKGMDDATSPLLIAKKMNHIDIVRMLEENGAF